MLNLSSVCFIDVESLSGSLSRIDFPHVSERLKRLSCWKGRVRQRQMPKEENDKRKTGRWKLSQNCGKAHDENNSPLRCSKGKLVITVAPSKKEHWGINARVAGEESWGNVYQKNLTWVVSFLCVKLFRFFISLIPPLVLPWRMQSLLTRFMAPGQMVIIVL